MRESRTEEYSRDWFAREGLEDLDMRLTHEQMASLQAYVAGRSQEARLARLAAAGEERS